jgi:hypothetical protein
MCNLGGGKKIGHGEYGNVYMPLLKNVNRSEKNYTEGYVGKVMNEADAKIEYAGAVKIWGNFVVDFSNGKIMDYLGHCCV